MRRCNYCHVEGIKKRATAKGATVHLVSDPVYGGVDVYVVEAGGELDTSRKQIVLNGNSRWKMWCALLPSSCAC